MENHFIRQRFLFVFIRQTRELIRERTKAGLQSARARGRLGGRPKGYSKEAISKLLLMRSFYKDVKKSPEEIYTGLGLTRATFYRYAKILGYAYAYG